MTYSRYTVRSVVWIAPLVIALLVLARDTANAETTPSAERGLSSDTAYQIGDVDQVNLFSGNLSVTLPLGKRYPLGPASSTGLTLIYNSNSWVSTEQVCGDGGGGGNDYNLAEPDPRNNGGYGWLVSLGQLYPPSTPPYNADPGRWIFITPDAGEHIFADELHPDEPATPQAGTTFSVDSTYLRMKTSGCVSAIPAGATGECRMIESPDGSLYEFRHHSAAATDWRIARFADAFGNDLDITYSANTWTLTDTHGRVHNVNFDANGNVDSVVLEGIGGSDVTYDFQYGSPVDIERQLYGRPANCIPAAPANLVSVHTLDRLVMPDGSFYEFTYFDNDTTDILSGGMASLRLPSGGEIRYTYRHDNYIGEITSPGNPIVHADGVATRSLHEDPLSAATGTWIYDLVTDANPDSPNHNGMGQAPPCYHTRVVTDPLGNVAEHFFSTIKATKGWAYGLPFTYCDPDTAADQTGTGGPWVSQRLYEGVALPANLVREVQVAYTADGRAPQSIEVQGWNTRMTKRIEIYKDDADNQREVTFSDFDGMGHWRTATTTGTFGPSKTVSTTWNAGLGTLTTNPDATTGSGFTMPAVGATWVWGLFDERTVAQGTDSSKVEFAFDQASGALERQRTLAGTTPGDTDILRVLERNAAGFVTAEKLWGGDDPSVDFDDVYDTLADMDLPMADTEDYRVLHTYSAGVASTSKYVNPCDEAEIYLTVLDQTIDAKSGLPTAVRDASGFQTNLVYDAALRLLREEPEEGAWTTYTYQLPTVGTPTDLPTFETRACKPGFTNDPCLSANTLASDFTEYDGLGRKFRYAVSFPTQSDPAASLDRQFTYNALGWLLEETTWGRQKMTVYSNHDRFGRPGQIVPPGQPAIVLAYTGDRITGRRTQVETLAGSEQSCHQERFDHFGRLTVVRENFVENLDDCLSVSGDLTRYSYDEQDRLIDVCQNDVGGTCGQTRTFAYDGRGVLTSEVQPEIGPSGQGTVTYSYDSMGNPLSRDIAGSDNHSLRYRYDGAGRLTHVRQVTDSTTETTRLLKEFRYARDNDLGWSQGRLVEAIRWNWVNLAVPPLENFDEPGNAPVQVTNRYRYQGTAGRISEKLTTQRAGDSALAFRSSYTYDDLGNIKTLTYPQCLTGECASAAPPRTVQYSYSRGYLTAVTGYAPNIWYQEGGMLDTIETSNGVSWSQSVDANTDIQRPHEIMINGTSDNTDSNSGTYGYDGSGNITAIGGALQFRYDLLNRLTSGQARNGQGGIPFQTVQYDTYGNITTLTTAGVARSLPTSTSTNRLTGVGMAYDAAGNLTQANVDGFSFVYTYDALNSMKFYQSQSESRVFSYDADGERLETFRCPANLCGAGEGNERLTLRGLNGEVLRVYEGSPGDRDWVEDYVYANGQALARVQNEAGGPVTEYLHLDHLGSVRKVTNAAGAQVEYHEFFPFGKEATVSSADDSTLKFTGHERDEGSGVKDELDYMHARFCGPLVGRFLSVDPVGGRKHRPLSWNRYSYSFNNPMSFLDPDGRDVVFFARDDSSGGATNFGHAALRVFGDNYDLTFDFGRYRGGHGFLRVKGPGILRVWSNYAEFVKNQQKRGAAVGARYATPEEFDRAVIAYFDSLIADGELLTKTESFLEYQLQGDYDLNDNNCSTISLNGLRSGCSGTDSSIDAGLLEFIDQLESGTFDTEQLFVDTLDPRKIFSHLDASRQEAPNGVVIYYYSYNPPE